MPQKPILSMLRLSGRLAVLAACPMIGGCFVAPKEPRSIEHDDPVVKIPAIKQVTRTQNQSAIAHLVGELDNDDPAIRFYAIAALSRLTGQTLGYRYYDDEVRRRPSLEAWRAWLVESGGPASTRAAGAK